MIEIWNKYDNILSSVKHPNNVCVSTAGFYVISQTIGCLK